ncbi:hypothetical protein [Phytoactinopolyspora halophila]|nr:hypothetical protein [Phytoactinopolyspora halophila]
MLRAVIVAVMLFLAGCSSDGEGDTGAPETDSGSPAADTGSSQDEPKTSGEDPDEQRYPDVVDATAQRDGDTYSFTVTISSPYDTPDRYADGWRVVDADGTVYGEHTLMHDHANEQPFTRTQSDVEIPDDVDEVTIEGRDQEYGYGGATVTVTLPEE